MAQPLSLDLRKRAVARVEAGETIRSVAQALSIAPSSVSKWCQRYRSTGSAAPGQMGGHRPGILIGANRDWLLERTKTDFTLLGLVSELALRGTRVDYKTVWKFVHREDLSFKKKYPRHRAKPAQSSASPRAMESISK